MSRYTVKQRGRFGKCWHVINTTTGQKVARFSQEGYAVMCCFSMNSSFEAAAAKTRRDNDAKFYQFK